MSAIQPLGLWEAELVKVVRQMAIASFTIAISYACTVGPITKKDDEMCWQFRFVHFFLSSIKNCYCNNTMFTRSMDCRRIRPTWR